MQRPTVIVFVVVFDCRKRRPISRLCARIKAPQKKNWQRANLADEVSVTPITLSLYSCLGDVLSYQAMLSSESVGASASVYLMR